MTIVGIRREDKNRWERRVVLSPEHCKTLITAHGAKVIVQPSSGRCFHDKTYAEAGCTVSDDLSSCDIIIAVKEVPVEKLMEDKTYIFFSHTIKAQDYN
jgi:alpha-aminoadipic semialdehyde synthase